VLLDLQRHAKRLAHLIIPPVKNPAAAACDVLHNIGEGAGKVCDTGDVVCRLSVSGTTATQGGQEHHRTQGLAGADRNGHRLLNHLLVSFVVTLFNQNQPPTSAKMGLK